MPKHNRLQSQYASPRESPGYLLWRIGNEWQRQIRADLKDLDLTHVQFVLLAGAVWHGDQGEEVNQATLAKHAAIDKMMVSDVLKTLENKTLVIRSKSKKDGRSWCIVPTDEGVRRARAAMKVVDQTNRFFFSRSNWPMEKIVELLTSLAQF